MRLVNGFLITQQNTRLLWFVISHKGKWKVMTMSFKIALWVKQVVFLSRHLVTLTLTYYCRSYVRYSHSRNPLFDICFPVKLQGFSVLQFLCIETKRDKHNYIYIWYIQLELIFVEFWWDLQFILKNLLSHTVQHSLWQIFYICMCV